MFVSPDVNGCQQWYTCVPLPDNAHWTRGSFILQMIGRRCALFALGGLLILVLTVNVYFIRMIVESSPEKTDSRNLPVSDDKTNNDNNSAKTNDNTRTVKKSVATEMEERIKAEMRLLPSKYFKRNSSYAVLLDRLLTELKTMPNVQDDIWSIPSNNVSSLEILYD